MDNGHAVVLCEIADRLVQELREYADAAQDAGESIQSTEALLAEWDFAKREEFYPEQEISHEPK